MNYLRIALITGADGGLGSALVKEMVARDFDKIYATGMNVDRLELLKVLSPKIAIHKLDITSDEDIATVVTSCPDINILINNAGIELKSSFYQDSAHIKAEFEMKVNYLGTMKMVNAFESVLRHNNHSRIINVMSLASFLLVPHIGTYCASKAAQHFLTEGFRRYYQPHGVSVHGVYPGYINTKMVEDVVIDKSSPESVATEIFEQVDKNILYIFPDPMSKRFETSINPNINLLDI